MDVDADIAPLLTRMSASMQRIRDELLPLLERLDEDVLVSRYSLAEQARVNLAAAFAMAFALYALDKLSNRRPPASSQRTSAAGSMTVLTGGGAVDAQLVLKIERITEYIRKLRDIAQLQQQQQQQQQQQVQVQVQDSATTSSSSSSDVTRKRARDSAADADSAATDTATTPTTTTSADHTVAVDARHVDADSNKDDALGDAALFAVVARTAGQTGGAVQQLLRHVTSSSSSS